MKDHSSVYISGPKTADDWKVARKKLIDRGDTEKWQRTFDDFFRTRLNLCYLHPIKVLQEHDTLQGEGFSIAAIQCSLIEFLESTVQGKTYRYARGGERLQPYEDSSSSEIFQSFLTNRSPFREEFTNEIASDFYSSVRCGLLHEAQTKNGWLIRAINSEGKIIGANKKILFRNNFQEALLRFVEDYGIELQQNSVYQEAFIQKFDNLCK